MDRIFNVIPHQVAAYLISFAIAVIIGRFLILFLSVQNAASRKGRKGLHLIR